MNSKEELKQEILKELDKVNNEYILIKILTFIKAWNEEPQEPNKQ